MGLLRQVSEIFQHILDGRSIFASTASVIVEATLPGETIDTHHHHERRIAATSPGSSH
jgi:hypothetical protein